MSDQICGRCHERIEVHRLYGHRAVCAMSRRKENWSSFTVREVNDMRRVLGHSIGELAQRLELRER